METNWFFLGDVNKIELGMKKGPNGFGNVKNVVNREEIPHHVQVWECPPPPWCTCTRTHTNGTNGSTTLVWIHCNQKERNLHIRSPHFSATSSPWLQSWSPTSLWQQCSSFWASSPHFTPSSHIRISSLTIQAACLSIRYPVLAISSNYCQLCKNWSVW